MFGNHLPAYYEFYCPVKIISGETALENIPAEMKLLSAKKPIIVTDQGVVNAGLLKTLLSAFAESDLMIGAVYDRVPADSSLNVVNEVAAMYRETECDSFIALGGGSVIDTSKAANIVVSEQQSDIRKLMGSEVLTKPLRPLIVIPTTAGTGSEVTTAAVISDTERGIKLPFTSTFLMPNLAVLDIRMTLSLPPYLTAATGMDALTHAVEAVISVQRNPLSDVFAFTAMDLIRQYFLTAVKNPQDKTARLGMANASLFAGISFTNAMVGLVHAFAHATGGICHTPHGVANSIYLPFGLRKSLEKGEKQIGEMLLPLGGSDLYAQTPPDQRPQKTIEWIEILKDDLYQLTKLPRTLSEAGIQEESLPAIAKGAINDGSILLSELELDYEEALAFVKQAYC